MVQAEMETNAFWHPFDVEHAPVLPIPDESDLTRIGHGADSHVYRTLDGTTVWKVYHNRQLTYATLRAYQELTTNARLHVAHLPFIKLADGHMVAVSDIVPFDVGYDERILRFVARQAFVPGPNVNEMVYVSYDRRITMEKHLGMEEKELQWIFTLGQDANACETIHKFIGTIAEDLGNRIGYRPSLAGMNVKVRMLEEDKISLVVTDLMASIRRLSEAREMMC